MNQQSPNQFPNQPYPEDQYEMMQMRQTMRDGEHLNLMAILHYVWAGLIGLGAVFFIGYMVIMGTIFKQAMMSVPATLPAPTSAPASPGAPSSSAPSSTPPVQVLPAAPESAPGPTPGSPTSTTTTTGSSGSTTYTTYSTGSSKAMVESMINMMYIIYGVFAGLCVIGCICNILSARFMKKRKHRVFSMVIGAFNVVMVPLGTVLGIFTFIVLCRQNVAQMYTPTDTLTQRDPR